MLTKLIRSSLLLAVLLSLSNFLFAQNHNAKDHKTQDHKPEMTDTPEKQVEQVLATLFDGMRNSDTTHLREIFHPEHEMHSVFTSGQGKEMLQSGELDKFIQAVGEAKEAIWDEQLENVRILVDDRMAVAWAPYRFYIGETFSHCGVNTFLLVQEAGKWKILELTDTRRRADCD